MLLSEEKTASNLDRILPRSIIFFFFPIGTYINYAVAGGLILALTSLLPDKTQDVAVPFELPKLELPSIPDFPIQSKLNTINLPPNVPEGM